MPSLPMTIGLSLDELKTRVYVPGSEYNINCEFFQLMKKLIYHENTKAGKHEIFLGFFLCFRG
jgi:hypothetical protein